MKKTKEQKLERKIGKLLLKQQELKEASRPQFPPRLNLEGIKVRGWILNDGLDIQGQT